MTIRKKLANKVFVLGVDGLDPRFSKKMLREGSVLLGEHSVTPG